MDTEFLASQLKTASDQLRTSQAVIIELSNKVAELEHALHARDVAVKLAAAGHLHPADLPEKVAEFESKEEEDLELEEKVASYAGGVDHQVSDVVDSSGTTNALSFLNL